MLSFAKVLIANRGEIAVRIIRAVRAAGGCAVAVYPADDRSSLHVARGDEAVEIPGQGTGAYLDVQALVAAAVASGCEAVHPGYGFLSESAEFARACEAAGVVFVGPDVATLEMLGDKARARAVAGEYDVPVLPGTVGATSLQEVQEFAAKHGAVMLKPLAGGGGRGMRAVTDPQKLAAAVEACSSEARSVFGDEALYVERLVRRPRHIEIQIIGDGRDVQHVGERDCSIQRRHQKLVEVAPSPSLEVDLRARIINDAVRLAGALQYRGLGTVEFLVDGEEYFFMEANPRLQVEHTVTEEVSGIDLVTAQLAVATGASLDEVGLRHAPALHGYAVQARVNLETLDDEGSPRPSSGTLGAFTVPSGPGVRVDTDGYSGYRVSPRYDPLIAKVIAHGDGFTSAAHRAEEALAEFDITGVETNLDLMHAIVTDSDFTAGNFDTGYMDAHLDALRAHHRPRAATEVGGAGAVSEHGGTVALPEGTVGVYAPLSGVLVRVDAGPGDVVVDTGQLGVLEAMKMEHPVRAPDGLRLEAILFDEGDAVAEGSLIAYGSPTALGSAAVATADAAEDWSAEVDEIARRRGFAAEMGGEDKVAKQHRSGKLTARERIDALTDTASFREFGALTGFVNYDEDGQLVAVTPANFVAGRAEIDGRAALLGVDDFTTRGGSGDAAIHDKQIFLERYAREMRLPMIRLLDGASGGGSVTMARDAGFNYLPVNPAWDAVVDNLSTAPVVSAALGPTVGLGAARLAMSHLAIMVEGIGQLFTAGPPLVYEATGEQLTKEQLGGASVHGENGSVERIVGNEQAAYEVIRGFLGYLPCSVFEIPPVRECTDPAERRDEWLIRAIPRDTRRPYEITPILEAIFDTDSVFRYAEYGQGTVTALARLDGHPVGVITSDPLRGATMTVEGAQAIERLVDLCETFHLPIVSLTDQAGVTIGSEGENRAAIRAGTRAITAVYQARVPQAEIILRRVYGVGGAGIVNRHRASRSWSWPSGDWGSLPARGGIEAAFRREIEGSEDPEAAVSRIAAELEAIASPLRTAEHFGVQDLIDPRESRTRLCDWVHDAYRVLPELTGAPTFGMRP